MNITVKPKALTPTQIQMLRRLMVVAGQELIQMANSKKLPDQWGEIGCTTYGIEAMAAVYNQMAADGMLPKRG
jgi:hypothetical protein